MPILSIIIPAYNEEKTIHLILDKVKGASLPDGIQKEVVIVNDFSTDNTHDAIASYINDNPEMPISYHSHDQNKGKGAALHTGIVEAKGDFFIIQDADLEYDPNEYSILLQL